MPDNDMETEGMPSEPQESPTTGSLGIVEANGERLRSILRTTVGVTLAVLLMGNILMYSLHKGLHAHVANQDRRIERLYDVVDDLIIASGNAEKIEKIEQKVENIDGQMKELTEFLHAENAEADAATEATAKAPKKKR